MPNLSKGLLMHWPNEMSTCRPRQNKASPSNLGQLNLQKTQKRQPGRLPSWRQQQRHGPPSAKSTRSNNQEAPNAHNMVPKQTILQNSA